MLCLDFVGFGVGLQLQAFVSSNVSACLEFRLSEAFITAVAEFGGRELKRGDPYGAAGFTSSVGQTPAGPVSAFYDVSLLF